MQKQPLKFSFFYDFSEIGGDLDWELDLDLDRDRNRDLDLDEE